MKKGLILGILAIMVAGCGGKKIDNKEREEEYSRILGDSISIITQEIDSCDSQIKTLNESTGVWVRDFTTVTNPREVGSYMIYTSFKNRYPLTGTGLVARVNDTGGFELIAALSRGTFDRIVVEANGESISSDVVPHDQALNYRTDALNTVSFTGEKADEIGKLIADNRLNSVKVNFFGKKLMSTWNMPDDYKQMVMATWMLYSSGKEANRLERRVQMLHQKINILRAHRDREDNAEQNIEKQ